MSIPIDANVYAGTIKPARSSRKLLKADGVTRDIIQAVNEVEQTDRDDTEVFARNFRPTLRGLHRLYWFVKTNFRYQEDPDGQQWVQTPSYLNQSRVGDCKSYTVFICSVLWNLGLDYIIRYVTDDPRSRVVTHVYPVAILPNGKRVALDCVIGEKERARTGKLRDYFNKEVKYYINKDFFIKNTNEMAAIYKLGSVQMQNAKAMLETDLFPDIPESIITQGAGDVTRMTSGQVDRLLMAERYFLKAAHSPSNSAAAKFRVIAKAIQQGSTKGVAGIGAIGGDTQQRLHSFLTKTGGDKAPAFRMPAIPPIPGKVKVNGVIQDIGNAIGDWFKKQWTKLMNWLFKGPAKRLGPYFSFMWLKERTAAIDVRRNIQFKHYNWLKKVGKFDDNKLKSLIFNGCLEATGLTPPQMIDKAAKGKDVSIGALGAIVSAAFKAIGWVVEVIQKIGKLFKKSNDNPKPADSNTSDLRMVEEMVSQPAAGGGPSPGKDIVDPAAGGGTGMAAAAAAAVLAMFALG